jgi:hypothetical protein
MSVAAKLFASRITRVVAAAFGVLSSAAGSAEAQTPFYQISPEEIDGPPGTLIRQEPMLSAPDGAAAYRVLSKTQKRPVAIRPPGESGC